MAKIIKPALIGLALILSLSACVYKTTPEIYPPFQNVTLKKDNNVVVDAVNLYVFSDGNSNNGRLVGTLVNRSDRIVRVSAENTDASAQTSEITIPAGKTVRLDKPANYTDPADPKTIGGTLNVNLNNAKVGADIPIKLKTNAPYTQSDNLKLQVIDKSLPGYGSAFPSPNSSIQAPSSNRPLPASSHPAVPVPEETQAPRALT